MTRVVVGGDVEVADGEDAGARAVDVGPLSEPDRLERVDGTLAESAGQLGPRDRELQEERADDRAEARRREAPLVARQIVALVRVGVVAEHLEHGRLRVADTPQRGAERRGSLRVGLGESHGRRNLSVPRARRRLERPGKAGNLAARQVPRVDFLRGEDVRRQIIALVVTTTLVAVAAATAALPRSGARYTGPTNSKVVNGFGNTVTFLAGSRSLKRFSFGTLGCFGYGTFPVGVDPYSTSLAQVQKLVPVTAKGTFALTSTPVSWSGGDAATKLKVTITGTFSSATAAQGTIWVSETGANGGSCGPVKMTFVAKVGSH